MNLGAAMRTFLAVLITILATEVGAFSATMRCDTGSDSPDNFYKYSDLSGEPKIFRRWDAQWKTWCDPTAKEVKRKIDFGWGPLITSKTVRIGDKGAVCITSQDYTLKQDVGSYRKGVTYTRQTKTIVDFEIQIRTTQKRNVDKSQASKLKGNWGDREYYQCELF